MKKKNPEMKVVYTFIEPKTKAEEEEAERRLASAYDIVFREVIRRRHALGYTGRIGHVPPGTKPPHTEAETLN